MERMSWRQFANGLYGQTYQYWKWCRKNPSILSPIITTVTMTLQLKKSKSDANDPPIIFRKNELDKHKSEGNRILVTYRDGVYDITDFIPNHPGGKEKIMLAAGSSIEPFWRVYQQHYNSPYALKLLETYRVGTLHPDDLNETEGNIDDMDPYKDDPKISAILKFHQRKPFNAEPPRSIITDNWITPIDLWFVRNHHPVPNIDVSLYTLQINGLGHDISLSYEDLKTNFDKFSVVSTIQCGGNRRNEMNELSMTNGSAWDIGKWSVF